MNWLYVPPYSEGVDTTLSPTWQMVVMARNCADIPEETATAPTPPSSAATRFSKTSFVGFCDEKGRGKEAPGASSS